MDKIDLNRASSSKSGANMSYGAGAVLDPAEYGLFKKSNGSGAWTQELGAIYRGVGSCLTL